MILQSQTQDELRPSLRYGGASRGELEEVDIMTKFFNWPLLLSVVGAVWRILKDYK